MKKAAIFLMTLALCVAAVGCDDDNDTVRVPDAVKSAFSDKFPGALQTRWSERGGYLKAEFRADGTRFEAWFDSAGKWYMTEEEIAYEELPAAVRSAVEGGEYADWRCDEVDKITREGYETLYVIDLERGESEVEAVYSADGVLLRTVTDADDELDELLPQELPREVRDFLAQRYPAARIVDAERERGGLEVDIIDGSTPREVRFTAQNAWEWTSTELRLSQVPAVVTAALAATPYAGWEVDDVEFYESPGGNWYRLEVEDPRSDREAVVRIGEDGTVL